MKEKVRILNPILHCEKQCDLYKEIAECSRKTWLSNKHSDIRSFFYFGAENYEELQDSYLEGDKLFLKCPDNWVDGGLNYVSILKMVKAFEFCLDNFDFDFLLRTASGTYVNYDNLFNFTNQLPDDFSYGGIFIGNHFNEQPVVWAAGHAILMSQKFAKLVVENKDLLLSYNFIDDVALGLFASESNIQTTCFRGSKFEHWFLSVDEVKNSKEIPVCSRCKPRGELSRHVHTWIPHTCELFNTIHEILNQNRDAGFKIKGV